MQWFVPQMEPLREDPQYQTFDYLMKEFHLQQEIESATRVSEPSGAVRFPSGTVFVLSTLAFLEVCFRRGTGLCEPKLDNLAHAPAKRYTGSRRFAFHEDNHSVSSGKDKFAHRSGVELYANKIVAGTPAYHICAMACSYKARGNSASL